MEYPFSGKVALVTGAASGIGKATALAFAQKGASVVLADIQESDTLDLIKAGGGSGIFIHTDVSREDQVAAMVAAGVAAYGRLDFAFNNAGIEGEATFVEAVQETDWMRIIDVNLKGVFLCMKHQIPIMRKTGNAAIVNCASIAGLVGFAGLSAYGASKHGVVGLTKAAALENARKGIRVNAVCPGVIRTPMVERFVGEDPEREQALVGDGPMRRLGLPEEIAKTVLFLCSEEASFTTGQAIAVDGGWTSK